MSSATLLLPSRHRLAGQALSPILANALGRADAVVGGEAGERAQLLRHFDLLPARWPVAALTRSQDAGDATTAQWLRADPSWIRPDINGARLFACGDGMHLSREDADALLPALRTLFGDAGLPIDAPTPSRWYLRMPVGAPLPPFPGPDEALGLDLFEVLVGTEDHAEAGLRRWRGLLNEAQIVLHNHPWNARRAAAGKPPVNSLWFWGGGVLPDQASTRHSRVQSGDVLLVALAANAGAESSPLAERFEPSSDSMLLDLREARDLAVLERDWLLPALRAVRRRSVRRLELDFADGSGLVLAPAHGWRWWRRPLAVLAPIRRDDFDGDA